MFHLRNFLTVFVLILYLGFRHMLSGAYNLSSYRSTVHVTPFFYTRLQTDLRRIPQKQFIVQKIVTLYLHSYTRMDG